MSVLIGGCQAPPRVSTDDVASPITASPAGLTFTPLADTLESAFSSPRFVLTSGSAAPAGLRIERTREGAHFRFRLVNASPDSVTLREVVLADVAHGFAAEDAFYGEGFNMFSSTGGTLGTPIDLDPLTDRGHYRLPAVEGFRTVYNYLHTTASSGETTLIGFTSAKRFHGQFNINSERLQIVVMLENLTLASGEHWDLEELVVASASDSALLLDAFADRILTHHPRLPWPKFPTGWCSWYAYYSKISEELILDNLAALKANAPELGFVQIDDGYQPWMGDWLEATEKFAKGVKPVIQSIKEAGFVPAIWVAPFIASPESRLFLEHPEWFVRGDDGRPLPSDKVTFKGWRQGPWYMLDGSHPEACAYLEKVFRTMRGWGCTYFKLDANLWGSFPAGRRHDPTVTSVEAYRLGMEAVRRGAGEDSLLLGCNHAYWPSLGTIHASRTSYDIERNIATFQRVARQNLPRNWMNDRLWWNDPDCLLIPKLAPAPGEKPRFTAEQFSFHAAATYATGGMMLSGDAVVDYSPKEWEILRRAMKRPPIAARFSESKLEIGVIDETERRVVTVLNWEIEKAAVRTIPVMQRFGGASVRVTDFWTDEIVQDSIAKDFDLSLPPEGGRVLVLEPVSP